MEGVILNRIPEVTYPAPPDVPTDTLGRIALAREAEATVELRILDQKTGELPVGPEDAHLMNIDTGTLLVNTGLRSREVNYQIAQIKERISELSPQYVEMFESYCDASVPERLRVAKDNYQVDTSWTEWLQMADRPQMLEFLGWHVDAVERIAQEPAVVEAIAVQKAEYKVAMEQAINEGWLHPDAGLAIERVDDIKVRAGDIFNTLFKQCSAYHVRGTKETVFSIGSKADFTDPSETVGFIERTTKHELNHAILGRFMFRWLDEAATEHIAHSLDHGRVETVEPNKRLNLHPPIYKEERRLLAYILHEGSVKIPARLVTRAYSEPADLHDAQDALAETVDQAWAHVTPSGRGALRWLNCYVSQLEGDYVRNGMTAREAGTKAAITTLRDLQHQPEAVFKGNPGQRQLIFVPS